MKSEYTTTLHYSLADPSSPPLEPPDGREWEIEATMAVPPDVPGRAWALLVIWKTPTVQQLRKDRNSGVFVTMLWAAMAGIATALMLVEFGLVK